MKKNERARDAQRLRAIARQTALPLRPWLKAGGGGVLEPCANAPAWLLPRLMRALRPTRSNSCLSITDAYDTKTPPRQARPFSEGCIGLSKRKTQKLLTQRTQSASASLAFLLFAPFALRLSAPRPVRHDFDLAVREVAHVGVERRAHERDLLSAPQPLLGVALRLDLRERGGGRHG